MAFIVLRKNGIDKWNTEELLLEEIKRFCQGRLPGFAIPSAYSLHKLPCFVLYNVDVILSPK